MVDLDNWDGQYRRPRPHFSDEKTAVHPSLDRRQLLTGGALLAGFLLLLTLAFLPRTAVDNTTPEAAQVQSDTQQTTAEGCQLIQRMTYTPCQHNLTRRQVLPTELTGKSRQEISAAYDMWQVTSFSASEVAMEQTLDMFCPEHMVLMPDESGMLCIFQNKYGDALALVRQLNLLLAELPEDVQDTLRHGKGFPTIEELEKWLESAES